MNISVKRPKQQFVTILLPVRNQQWAVKRDRYGATGPYAYSGDQWVGYEDIESVKEKVHVLPINVRTYKFWYITNVCEAPYCVLCRAVFTHGPKGTGPRAANFQG
jgi:hypothetical protein